MQEAGTSRVLRGGIAASAATAAALAGHTLGGAPLPGLLGVLVPWWLSVAVCCVLVGRQLTLARLGAAVLSSQVLFHLLFVAGSTDFLAPEPAGAAHAHAHHGIGGDAAATAGGSLDLFHLAHLTGAMLLGHVAAAGATIAVLRRGDRLLAHLARFTAEAGAELRAQVRAFVRALLAPLSAAALPSAPSALLPAPTHRTRIRATAVAAEPDAERAPPLQLAA